MKPHRFGPTTLLLAAACSTFSVQAQTKVKLGVLTDMSGALSDYAGPGSVQSAQLAVEDFLKTDKKLAVEVVSADHQIKPDIGATVARRWFDQEGVDAIVDVPGSAIVLAVSHIARDRNKVLLSTTASSSRITGTECGPNTLNWTYSAWALANGTGGAVVRQGGDSWFFVSVDWEFGHSVQRETTKVLTANNAKVLGTALYPLGVTDFSSQLVQAQASKAKVIGIAAAGADNTAIVKQAGEFGITQGGQKLATLHFSLTDVHALGLQNAQGLMFTTAWYWDLNDATRAFSKRFAARMKGQMPSQEQAGVYSAVTQYLRAISRAGSAKDGKAVLAQIRKTGWFDDPLYGKSRLREDGTVEHAMYLVEVKKPAESKGPWDYYKVIETIAPEKAFQPMAETGCPLVAAK